MKSSTKLGFFVLTGFGALIFFMVLFKYSNTDSGLALGVDLSKSWSFNYKEEEKEIKINIEQNEDIEKVVNKNLKDIEGEFAIVIEDLNGIKKSYTKSSEVIFPAASLYKLFLIAAAYDEIEKGSLKEESIIVANTGHLAVVLGFEDYGYEDLQGQDISYTVSEILQRIAHISDNYASIMLAEKIGWDKIQLQAEKIGASSTSIESPISTTAADIALFFQKLYKKEIVSFGASEKIITLLSESELNNRIPSKLPKKVKVVHKTGELPRVRHDAGIVYLETNPYLIVLMSKDLKGEDQGISVMADISKDIYDYFTALPDQAGNTKQ